MLEENGTHPGSSTSISVVDVGSANFTVLFFSLFHSGTKNAFPLMDDNICYSSYIS